MENKIAASVYYSGELIGNIENDNPSFDLIAKFFIDKEDVDYQLIKVSSDRESFDTEALKESIIEAIKGFLDTIKKDKLEYEAVLKAYARESSEN